MYICLVTYLSLGVLAGRRRDTAARMKIRALISFSAVSESPELADDLGFVHMMIMIVRVVDGDGGGGGRRWVMRNTMMVNNTRGVDEGRVCWSHQIPE